MDTRRTPRIIFLDDGVSGIALAVDGVSETHNQDLLRQHLEYGFSRLLGGLELFDQRHRGFVGTAVKGAAKRSDAAGDGGVEIGEGGCADAAG